MDAPGGPPPIHPPIAASLRNNPPFPVPQTVPPIPPGQKIPTTTLDQRKPNVPVPGTRAIFVGNFEYDSRTADIERLFSQYGSVTRVDLKRGFAFVFMQSEEQGETAIRALDGKALDETRRRPLKVEWARGDGLIKRREDERRRRSTEPSDTLFVVNFDPVSTTRQQLEHFFAPFGPIVRLDLQNRFAFIQFGEVKHATTAMNSLNGMPLGDRYLIVEYTVRSVGSTGRRRPRDYMMPPIDGPRPMMPRDHYRRGRSPSPRGMYGRARHERPWGPRPPHPDDHPYSPRGFRGREPMSYYDGNRESDSGWGEHLERFRAERGLKNETGDRERREETANDLSRRRTSRSPSPTRKYRNQSRSRSRSTSPTGRKRARSRSRSWDRGAGKENRRRSPHSRSVSPYRRGTRRSRSNSRSRSRSRDGKRYRTSSPAKERARGTSPVRHGKTSNSRSASPVAGRSKSPNRKTNENRSPLSDRSRSRSPVMGRRRSGSPSRKRARSSSIGRSGRGHGANGANSGDHDDRSPSSRRKRNRSRSPRHRSPRPGDSSRSKSRSPGRRRDWSGNRGRSQSLSNSRSGSHSPRRGSPGLGSTSSFDQNRHRGGGHEDMKDAVPAEAEIPTPSQG